MGSTRLTIPLPPTFLDYPGESKMRWSNWLAQLDNFFYLTDLTNSDDKKLTNRAKNAYVSSLLGAEGSRILMTHPVASKATTTTYEEFCKEVKTLFERPTNPVRAEFEFRSRRQAATESVADFMTALRTLYVETDHPGKDGTDAKAIEDHNLAMQLAIGCYSRQTQEKLLQQEKVDLSDFLRIMSASESASQSTAAMRDEVHADGAYHIATVAKTPGTRTNRTDLPEHNWRNNTTVPCFGCGRSDHRFKSRDCPAIGKICNFCGNLNHFSGQCLKKKKKAVTQNSKNSLQLGTLEKHISLRQCEVTLAVEHSSQTVVLSFMVDTGADISTIHESCVNRHFPNATKGQCDYMVRNFDGSVFRRMLGTLDCSVTHKGRHSCVTLYIVPDQLPAVAGRDLVHSLGLVIDGQELAVRTATIAKDDILMKFPSLTSNDLGTYPDYEHNIKVSQAFKPHVSKLRPVPLAKRDAVMREIEGMVNSGVWSPIDKSECAHAMVLVNKKNGDVRITTDLSPLNDYVVPDRHPLPLIEDLLLKLRGMSVYSKVDLRKGYFHILLDEASRKYTATITPLGLMAYNRLPMGLKDSASVFQKCVSKALSNCSNCISYIDDILIFGANQREHDEALHRVLAALSNNQFRLNVDKCQFSVPEISFLGFRINPSGIHPNTDKIGPIKNAPPPTNLKQLQAFLGAVNYLSEFIPNLANKAEHLRLLTRKDQPFVWKSPQQSAFQNLKDAISEELQLSIFDPNAPTIVTVDASDVGLGAQLSQVQDGREVPIQFASHTLTTRERNFATNEREALACLWAAEHWEKFLLARPFVFRTDHGTLRTLLKRHSTTRKSAKFARWLERLSRFDYTIEYIKGSHNIIADALSRLPQPSCDQKPAIEEEDGPTALQKTIAALTAGPISVESIQKHTQADPLLTKVIEYTKSVWPDKKKLERSLLPFYQVRDDLAVEDGCLTRSEHRFVVPASMQQTILKTAHEGHPGIVRAKRQLRQVYWWPRQAAHVEEFVKHCLACQDSAKSHKPTQIPCQQIEQPSEPWKKIGIDICGPFANAPQHQRFVTVVIDYHSGFPEVLLSGEITSTRIIRWLTEIFARYGNPSIIVSDNGRQFVSEEFKSFLRHRDILHWTAAVYNPQQNGKVEAFNRFLKHGVQTFNTAKKAFEDGIQELLFSYRATCPTSDRPSPAELLFGRRIRTNFEPASRKEEEKPLQQQEEQSRQPVQTFTPIREQQLPRFRGPYKVNDLVRVRLPHVQKGYSPFSSPRKIIEVLGNYTYRLSDGQVWNARRLVRARTGPTAIEMEGPERPEEARQPLRQFSRKTRGIPPSRFPTFVNY